MILPILFTIGTKFPNAVTCIPQDTKERFAMGAFVEKSNLKVAAELADFVENAALPGTGVDADAFWVGFSDLVHELGPKNRALLAKREDIQSQVDAWHVQHRDAPHDVAAYKARGDAVGDAR